MANSLIKQKLKELETSKTRDKFWNISKRQSKFLREYCKILNPKNILELGTSNGYSTLSIISELKAKADITTIEINEERFKIAKNNLTKSIIHPHEIKILNNDFFKLIEENKLKGKFDLIFIDLAQNKYLEILKELEKNNLFQKEKFRIIFDNIITHRNNHKEFFKYIESKYKYKILELDNGFLIIYDYLN